MHDIKLLETCKKCGANLTLMSSIRCEDGTSWLVKRCLNCGGHQIVNDDGSCSIEEVTRLYESAEDKDYCEWCKDFNGIELQTFTIHGLRRTAVSYCPRCGKKLDNKVKDNLT
jgi:hypothetical protein